MTRLGPDERSECCPGCEQGERRDHGLPPAVLWVEGVLGVGKTTLTRALAGVLGWRPVFEPVATNPYLEMFYENPQRWAFAMQMELLFRRWQLQQLATWEVATGLGAILDRGMPGDQVFARANRILGNITEVEWGTYWRMYESLMRLPPLLPQVLLYLRASPEVAAQRIAQRARPAERQVSLDYLRLIHQEYEALVSAIIAGQHSWSRGMRVVVLDWDQPLSTENVVERLVEALCTGPAVRGSGAPLSDGSAHVPVWSACGAGAGN